MNTVWQNISLEDLPNEKWRHIPGYKGLYKVSNMGRVKSLARISYHGMYYSVKVVVKEKIRKQRRAKIRKSTELGYPYVNLSKDGVIKTYTIYNLVMWVFRGKKRKGQSINHKNLDKCDSRLDNLEYVTPKQNTDHYIQNNKSRFGENWTTARFTNYEVLKMREDYSSGKKTQVQLAKEYNTHQGHIGLIVRGESYKHI